MSKWHSFLEYLQFPLKILFLAMLMLGIGNVMINPYLELTRIFTSSWYLYISDTLRFLGGFLIELFPLLVFLKVLTRKYEDSAPVFVGFISLIIITLMMALFSVNEFPSYYYTNTLGIEMNISLMGEEFTRLHSPYNTGIISLFIAYFITSYAYRKSRHYVRHGLFYIIDHDTKAVLTALVWSLIAGIALAYLWPIMVQLLQTFYAYVAEDIYDVGHMFFYGIHERLFSLLNIDEIPKSVFWLSEAGGSTIDAVGNTYLGDSGLWAAFLTDSTLVFKSGNFIGAYYIINFALIPAFILAYYKLMGKSRNKKKYLIFIILAVALSYLSGCSLAAELLMLILCPLLYVFYLLLVGIAYVVVSLIGSLPGYSVGGSLLVATPGSIIDLLFNMPHASLFESTVVLLIFAVFFFIIFYIATIFYFKHCAVGLLGIRNVYEIANESIDAMGGLENIQSIETTPDKMSVAFKSRDVVNLRKLYDLGAYLILESKDGYIIRMENMNIMIGDIIVRKQKETM